MIKNFWNSIIAAALILCSAVSAYADVDGDGRPKLRELNERKVEVASHGLVPMQKKDKWGYADSEGKFIIRPLFLNAMPICGKQVGFVSYMNDLGRIVWTPININGYYLTGREFAKVVQDFDDRGLAVVEDSYKYGVIDHTGKMVLDCSYTHYLNRSPVYLFRTSTQSGCVAVVHDASPEGYETYTFAEGEPIILKSEGGYGVISPVTQRVVASFEYDSVKECVENSIYILQKGPKYRLYADDMLSADYDEIVPGQHTAYFVVKKGGKYGVLDRNNKILLNCMQDEIPVLKKDEYTAFYENGQPVYAKWGECITASKYDDYLYRNYLGRPADYLLDATLAVSYKKYLREALASAYGTKDFARLKSMPEAADYAASQKYILLVSDSKSAKYLDLKSGKLTDVGKIAPDAIPDRNGEPAYVIALNDQKYGVIDIRTNEEVLPFSYDAISSVGKGYLILTQNDLLPGETVQFLYNIWDKALTVPDACTQIYQPLNNSSLLLVKQKSHDNFFDLQSSQWLLPDGHFIGDIFSLPESLHDSTNNGFAVFAKKDGKGALFSLPDGERLTEYLFDSVASELVGGKYYMVHEGKGKSHGIYDVAAGHYVLTNVTVRDWDTNFYNYQGDELLLVSSGIYNVTKRKYLDRGDYNAYQVSGGYVLMSGPKMNYVFSLETNQKFTLDDYAVDRVALLDDGYVIFSNSAQFGIYNSYKDIYLMVDRYGDADFVADFKLYKDFVFMPGYGVVNYKMGTYVTRQGDWADWADASGDYVWFCGGFEAESKAVYSLRQDETIMEHGGCYKMEVLSSQEDPCLTEDYIIFASYGASAGGGIDYYTPTPWLPWDDTKGGYGLYDIDDRTWLFPNSSELEYIGNGLLKVSSDKDNGIYDLANRRWIYRNDGRYKSYKLLPGNIDGYDVMKRVASESQLEPQFNGSKWRLYDSRTGNAVPFDFEYVVFMYE